jgi:hypothetical protein
VEAGRAEPVASQSAAESLGRGRIRQILAYGRKVFGLDRLLGGVGDQRRHPVVSPALVARIVFLLALLRVRSFNALEPKLGEPWWQRALGERVKRRRVCSADTLSYSLQRMDVSTTRDMLVAMIKKAERNKVFREGWFNALRFVALDGWEPFSSYHRHCRGCLTRQVTIGNEVRTQYYHRYVVALLLDERLEVVLDMEPILSADLRREHRQHGATGHEGELTAARRLVQRLRNTYGGWLDVIVGDALYAAGPFLNVVQQCGYGALVVLKKEHDEPLREAMALWGDEPPHEVVDDVEKKERVELWDCPELETLSSYRGPIRVVRALVHKQGASQPSNWCFGLTGKATRLSAHRASLAGRGRWHLENTGFCQWTKYWHFAHIFTHGVAALPALLYIFFAAFNLLQLFAYRQLGGYGRDRGRDVTRTLWRLVDEMNGDLERLQQPIAWDTS